MLNATEQVPRHKAPALVATTFVPVLVTAPVRVVVPGPSLWMEPEPEIALATEVEAARSKTKVPLTTMLLELANAASCPCIDALPKDKVAPLLMVVVPV